MCSPPCASASCRVYCFSSCIFLSIPTTREKESMGLAHLLSQTPNLIIFYYYIQHIVGHISSPLAAHGWSTIAASFDYGRSHPAAPQSERTSQQKLRCYIDSTFSLTFAKLAFFESHYSTSKEIGRLWNVLEYSKVCCGFCEVTRNRHWANVKYLLKPKLLNLTDCFKIW
jgi:hypothetical protein